ncbi:NUDIX hydrolase [Candidatus Woesearchaeota archaeon]|nr:NUDIX hydrolase [Candidatus Woesearchaeota archaeon]
MQITSVAVFIKDNNILLEKRRESEDNYADCLALPGGHKKKNESPKKALIREIKEELNVKVKEAKPLGMFEDKDPTSKDMFHHHAFLIIEYKGKIKKTAEQEALKWINLNKIKKLKNINKVDVKILKKAKLV